MHIYHCEIYTTTTTSKWSSFSSMLHVGCPAINALFLLQYYGLETCIILVIVVVIVSQLSCFDGCVPISVLACPDLACAALPPLAAFPLLTYIRYFQNGFCFSCSFTLFILVICSYSIPYCGYLLCSAVVVMGFATDFCLCCVLCAVLPAAP